MRPLALLFMLAMAFPVLAQDKQVERSSARPAAHSKPTPQQIRRFRELEKKQQKSEIRGRSPNSRDKAAARAPSPK